MQRQLGNRRRSINRLKRDSFLTERPSRDEKLEVEWQRLLQDDEVVQEDEIGQITDAIKARWFSPVLFRVFPQFVPLVCQGIPSGAGTGPDFFDATASNSSSPRSPP